MTDPVENQSPAEALEAARQSRGAVAQRLTQGSWLYDLAYGSLTAGIVAAQALEPPLGLVLTSLCTLALVGLMRVWVNKTGVFVTGLSPPRARWVAIGLGVVMAVLMLAAVAVKRSDGPVLHSMLLALAAGLIAIAASRLWLRVFIAETRRWS